MPDDDLQRQAQCSSKAMVADLGSSYRAGLPLATVAGFQRNWNQLLPSVRGVVGVILPSANQGKLVEDGLYGKQTGMAADNFIPPGTAKLPDRAVDMPTWFAQNNNAVEAMCPPAPPPLPVPEPITQAPTPTVPVTRAVAPPTMLPEPVPNPPPPPPVSSPNVSANYSEQCHQMWLDWLRDNPSFAKCLSRADEAKWMEICAYVAQGRATFEQGAGAWSAHVTQRCQAQQDAVVTVTAPPPAPAPVAQTNPTPIVQVSAPATQLAPTTISASAGMPVMQAQQMPPAEIYGAAPSMPWAKIGLVALVGAAAAAGGLYLMRR